MSPGRSPSSSKNSKALTLPRSLVLVGLMGAGKSTIGRRLARRLNVEFLDIDEVVVQEEGLSISDLFAQYGEAYFRTRERETIAKLLNGPPCIIASGGGLFAHAETRKLINRKGISMWLDAPLDILLERVSRRNVRPLLNTGDKREILTKLLDERGPAYAEAHLRVDSDVDSHDKVVRRAISALGNYISEENA